MDFRWAYKSAVTVFTDLVYRVPADRWDGPGLGDWSLRELAGHTVSSALRQVPGVLATPGPAVIVEAPEGYWASTPPAADDAKAAGEALGDDPGARVAEYARQATRALSAAGDNDVIAVPAGGMRVRTWIPTRTFELVVHGLDVAAAAGVPVEYATGVVAEMTQQAVAIAATGRDSTFVLRALTGRATLPPGYSVLSATTT
ncbi:maleylpyruvate isomerase family mycothiol-dependent enzyme [Actinoplanes sp. NPDC051494]|uniref:maleylpyruvate isomerase family mycothiol-dependent enzyme n=1 Tax=Actinoplanes sp. NPDC051494 TaxID=3363907 RepID=UPI0037A2DAEF